MIFGNNFYFEFPFTKERQFVTKEVILFAQFNVVLRSDNIYLDKMQK